MNEAGEKQPVKSNIFNSSRRNFMRGTIGLAASGLLAHLPKQDANPSLRPKKSKGQQLSETKESTVALEKEKPPSILIIDFWGDLKTEADKLFTHYFPQTKESFGQLLNKMAVLSAETEEELATAIPQSLEEKTAVLLAALRIHYQNHGQDVVSAREKASSFFGKASQGTEVESLSKAIQINNVVSDPNGNPTIEFSVSRPIIDQLVNDSKSPVINLSCQLGKFKMAFRLYGLSPKYPELKPENIPLAQKSPVVIVNEQRQGGEITYRDASGKVYSKEEAEMLISKYREREIKLREPSNRDFKGQDGYEGKDTYNNLCLLAGLAGFHPDKMFVAAAGNPQSDVPDITKAKDQLQKEDKWPKNLLMIGVSNIPTGFTTGDEETSEAVATLGSFGADFYIDRLDLENLGLQAASSFATPIVTELVSRLVQYGYDSEGITKFLQRVSTKTGTEENPLYTLNLEEIKKGLKYQEIRRKAMG